MLTVPLPERRDNEQTPGDGQVQCSSSLVGLRHEGRFFLRPDEEAWQI